MDQGCLGHADVKHTTIATISWKLVEDLRGRVLGHRESCAPTVCAPDSLSGHASSTRRASAWAPGLVAAIRSAWREWAVDQSPAKDLARLAVLSGMLKERGVDVSVIDAFLQTAWQRALSVKSAAAEGAPLSRTEREFRDHVSRGHLPWRKDCRAEGNWTLTCVKEQTKLLIEHGLLKLPSVPEGDTVCFLTKATGWF